MNRFYNPITSFFLSALFLLLTISGISYSQGPSNPDQWPTFTMTAMNISTNGTNNQLYWDVYILQTNYGQPNIQPFEFCCAQYNWYFNKNIFQNPQVGNATLTNLGAQTDLPSGLRPPTFAVDTITNYEAQGQPAGTGLLKTSGNLPNSEINYFIGNTFPGTKALRMRLTTNANQLPHWNFVPLNLRWRLGAAPNTFLAYFTPNPPGPDSANPQWAQSLLDTVTNQYFVENGNIIPIGSLQPLANFTSDVTVINAGGSVNFTNTSANNPTSYNWLFPGGNPSVSTEANPTNIVYNTPGLYHVSLRVSNSFGSDSISKTNYITVNQSPCTPTWSNYLHISDAGNIIDSVKFGTSPTATLNIDTCFGETPLPPLPPTGSYDIRFILQNPPNYDVSKIDIRPEPANDIFWKVKFQPSGSGYPITFSWNRNAFPSSGLFFLKDEITGTLVNIDMKAQSSYVLPANLSGVTSLKIVYQYNLISDISVTSGWNLLSVPLKAADMKFTTLFPNATSLAYNFNGIGYLNSDSAKVSKGYWLKFGRDTTYRIVGVSLTPKTIPVISGWNMIGPYDENIPVSSITSSPSGIVTSFYYKYSNGYFPVDTLKVGKGYWIKTSAAGTLMYNITDKIISENETQSDSLNNFTKFTITDNNGSISNLYLANASQITGNYDLPPVPPSGIFDVRFGSDKLVESYGQNNIINLNSASYPVKLKAQNLNGHSFRIKDNISGSIVNILIADETEIEITSALDNLLLIDENLIPESYSLGQNYPNPFNPSTKIKYQLPVDGNVKIIIFDLLGKEVQTLVNGFEKAGSYELSFNAINLASGIYFYKMQSENFSEIKRMILIK